MISCSFIISFVAPARFQKSFRPSFFTPQKIQHHHHHSACCIAGFSHWCIYTLEHIPKDDNFYLVCRQNKSLTQPLHCSIYYTDYLDHENLSLFILSTFWTYDRRTYLLFLSVLSPFFQIAVTQSHFKSFYIVTPTLLPQRH